MPKSLPHRIEPRKLAEHAETLQGKLLLKEMSRLAPSLASADGEVEIELSFGVDSGKIPFLQGQVKAQLILQCQRCLEPYTYEIMAPFLLGMIQKEQEAAKLPERYDPLIIPADGEMVLSDIIEDELIIDLPIVPMHDPKVCKGLSRAEDKMDDLEKENPFKKIEVLRKK